VAALADTLPFYGLVAWLRRWLEVPGEGAELGEEAPIEAGS
jgi:queuosine precursor transporter